MKLITLLLANKSLTYRPKPRFFGLIIVIIIILFALLYQPLWDKLALLMDRPLATSTYWRGVL